MHCRRIATVAVFLLAPVLGAACSKKDSPTAPKPPDNPNPPSINYVEHITLDTLWVELSPPDEDVVIPLFPRFQVRNPGAAWQSGYLDFSDGGALPRTVHRQATVIVVSGSSWEVASPERHLWVTLQRPGQTRQFEIQLY
jgi:hypothetical protein